MDLTSIARGSVFIWFDYIFDDGSKNDKYVITLNCKVKDSKTNTVKTSCIYIVLPTSQYDKHYKDNPSNLLDTVILKPSESRFFKKENTKTVIDLKKIIFKEMDSFKEAINKKRLKFLGLIEPTILKKIEEEIDNAFTISQEDKDILLCRNGEAL